MKTPSQSNLASLMNSSKTLKVAERLAGKADDEGVRRAMPGTAARTLSRVFRKISAPAPRFMRFEHVGRSVLQRHVEILADVVVARDGVEQPAGDAIGIGVEEAQPAQTLDARQRVEQRRQTVLDAQVFAVAGRVLADQRDLLHAAGDQLLALRRPRLEAPRAELAAQVRNHAETARVVAALGNLDVCRRAGVESNRGVVSS